MIFPRCAGRSPLVVGLLLAGFLVLASVSIASADHDHKAWQKGWGKDSFSLGKHRGGDKGNEFTGQTAGWIFAAANLPVALSLLLKGAASFVPLAPESRDSLKRFNQRQKKHLMRFHYILNPVAAIMALVHFSLSSCRSSALPEWGLVGTASLVLLGMAMKFKISPVRMRKTVYQIHTNPISAGLVLTVLLIGHSIVD
ncbi:MAG TPA: hypothetical protein DEO88_09345 [Syntrophobacteraceae bacterium]|nr:hypothetical protein [Syntrophobacteraceae bacterium]